LDQNSFLYSIVRLDPTLIRPGRVDFQQEIGHCTSWQLQQIFLRFYPEESSIKAQQFAEEIGKLPSLVTPAMLQNHFMHHKVTSRYLDSVAKVSVFKRFYCIKNYLEIWHE